MKLGVMAALIIAVGAVCTVPKASASISPPPVSDPAYNDEFWRIVLNPENIKDSAGWDTAPQEAIAMGQRAGTFPLLRSIGTIGLAVTTFEIGWKIGRTIDTKWLHLSDTGDVLGKKYTYPYTAPNESITGETWVWSATGYAPASVPGWYLGAVHGQNTGGCAGNSTVYLGWILTGSNHGSNCWDNAVVGTQSVFTNYGTVSGNWTAYSKTMAAGADTCGNATYTNYTGQLCKVYVVSETDMETNLEHSWPETFTTQAFTPNTTLSPAPSPNSDPTKLNDLRDNYLPSYPGIEIAIDNTLDPNNFDPATDSTGTGGGPITETGTIILPSPEAHETYDDYVVRLREVGALGTITRSDLTFTEPTGDPADTYDPERGPNEVVYTVPKAGTSIKVGVAITVKTNPSSAPAAGTGTGGDPGGVGGGGPAPTCQGYMRANLDLSPLLSLSFADQFPFAIFAWLGDSLTSWEATGAAPSFSVPLTDFDGKAWEIDFSVLDPAMPVVRATIVIVATLAVVWWLATALMGIGAAEVKE